MRCSDSSKRGTGKQHKMDHARVKFGRRKKNDRFLEVNSMVGGGKVREK